MKRDAKAVLDASAVLAILQDEPGADSLRPLLTRSVICSVNLAEVLAKLVRDGVPRDTAVAAVAALHVEEVGFDAEDAQRSAAFVGKGVSLGDRCFLAAAARYGDGFTSDRELLHQPAGGPKLHCFRG